MKRDVLALSLALLASFGCSTTTAKDPTGTGTPTSDPASPTDPNTPSDGTKPTDKDKDGDPTGDPPASGKTGTITLGQTVTAYSAQAYASAFFIDTSAVAVGSTASTCTTTKVSGCSVTDCTGETVQPPDPTKVKKPPHAGAIKVTGGSLPAAGLALTPDAAKGTYNTASFLDVAFDGGEDMVVSAKGGDVPAFQGKSVKAPATIEATAPELDEQLRTTIDRTKDLKVAWDGGEDGDVLVSFTTSHAGGGRHVQIQCKASAAGGQMTVPTAALTKLEKADGSKIYGSLSISSTNETTFKSGDYDVTFRVVGGGTVGTFIASK